MFWILRRTGAANFFNSLNNNCSTSKGSNSNSTQDKYVKRPPRKAYGRLSAADSDDAASIKHKIDDPFDDFDNFEIIAPGNANATQNGNDRRTSSGCARSNNGHDSGGVGGGGGRADGVIGCMECAATDCQGNYLNGGICELNMSGLCNGNAGGGGGGGGVGGGGGGGGGSGIFGANSKSQRQKEVNQNTINRLQAMAMSDDDDYDESLTCNVCDRAFHCHRQLASHQQKKRHFGCSGCDSLFPSLMLLEHHKEEFEHWSDDEISRRICCRRNRGDDYFTDTDSFTSEAESEDLERLL